MGGMGACQTNELYDCIKLTIFSPNRIFLGANAPLGPASSEGLSVCL